MALARLRSAARIYLLCLYRTLFLLNSIFTHSFGSLLRFDVEGYGTA